MVYKPSRTWFRLARRKTHPWLVLIITVWQLAWGNSERDQANVRLMAALVKINVVRVMALINELLW